MRITYGHQITSEEDPYVKIAERITYIVTNGGLPGTTPIDFFPFRRFTTYHTGEVTLTHRRQLGIFPRGFLVHSMQDLHDRTDLRYKTSMNTPTRKSRD